MSSLMETEGLSDTVAGTLRYLCGIMETWYYATTIHICFANMKHFQNIFSDSSFITIFFYCPVFFSRNEIFFS